MTKKRARLLFVEDDHVYLDEADLVVEEALDTGPPSWALTVEEIERAEKVILAALGVPAKYLAEDRSYALLSNLYAPTLERFRRS
jgi:hypothetical protein